MTSFLDVTSTKSLIFITKSVMKSKSFLMMRWSTIFSNRVRIILLSLGFSGLLWIFAMEQVNAGLFSFSETDEVTIDKNSAETSLTWTIEHPATNTWNYNLTIDGALYTSGSGTNGADLSIDVSDLDVGTYIAVLTLDSRTGDTNIDEFTLEVIASGPNWPLTSLISATLVLALVGAYQITKRKSSEAGSMVPESAQKRQNSRSSTENPREENHVSHKMSRNFSKNLSKRQSVRQSHRSSNTKKMSKNFSRNFSRRHSRRQSHRKSDNDETLIRERKAFKPNRIEEA